MKKENWLLTLAWLCIFTAIIAVFYSARVHASADVTANKVQEEIVKVKIRDCLMLTEEDQADCLQEFKDGINKEDDVWPNRIAQIFAGIIGVITIVFFGYLLIKD